MIKNLFKLAIGLIPTLTFSQTVFKSDIAPQTGEDYFQHVVDLPDSVHPGSPGINQDWDLTNVNFSLQNDYHFEVLDPAQTPHSVAGASCAIRNYPVIDATYAGYAYYKDTADGYYLIRNYGQTVDDNYASPEFVFRFPLHYGDSVTSNFCYTSNAFSITYQYCGTSKLKFDGVGTLWVNGMAPYPNIFRFKYESMIIRQSPNDTSYNLKYFWYQAGIHHPVAEYSAYTDPNGITYHFAKLYSTANTTGLNEPADEENLFCWPNPADRMLNIGSTGSLERICVFDLSGCRVAGNRHDNDRGAWINASELPDGIYLLERADGEQVFTRRFIVHHPD